MPETTAVLETGTEIAGFRIESLLADGGMGTVYLATQVRLGREVALKVLAAERADDPEFAERCIRESKRAASLHQPNVLPVYDAGKADGVIYVAMRYVEGGDLRRLLRDRGRISPLLTLEIGRQIALALGAAHAARLVHGDVKPANILLGGDDHAYLADFGQARRTADYAAPEQLDEVGEVDDRTDIYSLGCVLYHCLAGEPPYVRESEAGVIAAHLHDPVPQLAQVRPDLPPEVGAIVSKAMDKDRSNRYILASELAVALGAVLADLGEIETNPGPPPRESDTQPIAPTPAPLEGEERRRSRPWLSRRVVVGAVALALVAAAVGGSFAFGSSGSAPVRVPSVVGLTAVRAKARLHDAHLGSRILHGTSQNVPAGSVYNAKPGTGTSLPAGRTVTLWISTGMPPVPVPTFVGRRLIVAERKLAALGFTRKLKFRSSAKKQGTVIGQRPQRGKGLAPGSQVVLVVSSGPPKTAVPDVRGETAHQAVADLQRAGFKVSAASTAQTTDSTLSGRVASQSIPGGNTARRGSVVTIYLYYYHYSPPPPPPPPPPPGSGGPTTTGIRG